MPLLSSLLSRNRQPEVMDQPGLDPVAHEHALRDLARINWWSRSASILWPTIRAHALKTHRPLRVLDVATGAGDVPIGLLKRAVRAGLALEMSACDISETALHYAQKRATAAGVAIRFFHHDILTNPLPDGFDIVTSSLFLHHLDEADAIVVLQRMQANATRAVLVNDLERNRIGYITAWIGTRILSRSPVVHVDGPLSVRGAFSTTEALTLAEQAGLRGIKVSRHWPFRFLLSGERS